jgi:hypothetical protein
LAFSSFSFVFAAKYPNVCPYLNVTASEPDRSQGENVRQIQIALIQERYADFTVASGFYGPRTTLAVKAFQTANNIYPSGNVGPTTLGRMRTLWCSSGSSAPVTNPNQTVDVELIPNFENGEASLTWNSTNASSCKLNNQTVAITGTSQLGAITTQTSYTLICTNSFGGSAGKTVTISPNQTNNSSPLVSFSVNNQNAYAGQTVTFSWIGSNVTSCKFNNSNVNISGTRQVTVLANPTDYTLSCTGSNGEETSETLVVGNPSPAVEPTVNVTVNPVTVNRNAEVSIAITATNAISCTISGGKYDNTSITLTNRSANTTLKDNPTEDTTYFVTCYGDADAVVDSSAEVLVSSTNANNTNTTLVPTITYFSANPTAVSLTGTSLLSWKVLNSTRCNLSGGGLNKVVNASTTETVTPNANSVEYKLSCYSAQELLAEKTVTVTKSNSTVDLTVNNATVAAYNPTTLSWTSTNVRATAPKCTLDLGSTVINVEPTGSYIVSPQRTSTYSIKCFASNGSFSTDSVTVTVAGTLSIESFTATPAIVPSVGTTSLAWRTENATACTLSGGGLTNQSVGTSSSRIVDPNAASVTYTLNCTGVSGQTGSKQVTVTEPVATVNPVITTFSATPAAVFRYTPSLLSWSATNVRTTSPRCQVKRGTTLVAIVEPTGTLNVTPTANSVYSLSCFGNTGNPTTATTSVNVVTGDPKVDTFTATPANVTDTQKSTLTWTSSNANLCRISGGEIQGTPEVAINGTREVSPNVGVNNYSITCSFGDKTASKTVSVTKTVSTPAVTLTASTTPSTVSPYQPSVLSWVSTNARTTNACDIKKGTTIVANNLNASGNFTVTSNTTATYKVTCYSQSNIASSTNVTLNVVTGNPTISTLSATPINLSSTQTKSNLTWTTRNTNTCTLSGGEITTPVVVNTNGSYEVTPNTGENTYTLSCSFNNGTPVTRTVKVTKPGQTTTTPPNISINLSSSPAQTLPSEVVTLTWTTTGARTSNSCELRRGTSIVSLNLAANGSFTVSPTTTTTYRLSCYTDSGAKVDKDVTATVISGAPVVATLTASPTTVSPTGMSTLTWTSRNATICKLNGGGLTDVPLAASGTHQVDPNAASTVYTVTCSFGDRSASKNVTVRESSTPAINLTASPATVAPGQASQITWSSQNVNSCSFTNSANASEFNHAVETSGSGSIIVSKTTTFTLTCKNSANTDVKKSATVYIESPQTTPTDYQVNF